MKVLVVSSCTGQKRVSSDRGLTLDDFRLGQEHIAKREAELSDLLTPAEEMYAGQQHIRLMRGIESYRDAVHTDRLAELDFWILSAGYGLVPSSQRLAPYDATFAGMGKRELRRWSSHLGVPDAMREVLKKDYDLGLVLLGDAYLDACDLDSGVHLGGPTIVFCSPGAIDRLPQIEGLRPVALTNAEARRYSCGLVALKGQMASRILVGLACDADFLDVLRRSPDVLTMVDASPALPAAVPARSKSRADVPTMSRPGVDAVVSLPDSWRTKSHRSQLSYFIPEWDDLVDPHFDFNNDVHSGGSGDWFNEVYAHQLYREPNYDGILVSKVVAEKTKKKTELINRLGVHRFLRLPREFPVMGDCGAFGYINEKVPPYTTPEILEYYTRLDFDFGVSIDHLIVSSTMSERRERYELTINNAADFLTEHRRERLNWTPIGAVQGWDPKSYARAAEQCVAMGYEYIALGGLVRTPTREVLEVLSAVHDVVPTTVKIHLFGLARISAMSAFASLGVRSVDSASLLRRAWMGTGQNYLSATGKFYAAIRIPEAGKSFRAKRMVSEGRASLSQVQYLETRCLDAMRRFDAGVLGVDETLDHLEEYDQLITPERPATRSLLRETLEERPWEDCVCDICRRDGIQVVIFRGNNRNRRRGFHNTYVFYRLLQQALAGEDVSFSRAFLRVQADSVAGTDVGASEPGG